MVLSYTVATITGHRPENTTAAADWADALGRWDGSRLAAREALNRPANQPIRSPFPAGGETITVGDWTRRLAHEFAIHRLDAESALPTPVGTRFAPEFAEDGIDELLAFLGPRSWPQTEREGVVEVRAGDRSWTIVLRAGERPAPGDGTPDVTLIGSADEVYRALWGRPHAAETTGDTPLLAPLAAP
ncbi:hypothetical protein GCM10022222_41030 [Amycolatopsis ultiminotia]|uniref:MDMPI C-terminal domain-containing protein n=2 Tax=Amycolatopsis ultiminotia TaxID=543629 RepID=A0ABP6WNN6_9PSEU